MAKGTLNKVLLIGRLGKDPEIKNTATIKIAKFSIATNSRNSKTQEDLTEWHNCTAFGKLADIIEQYVTKGSQVYIEGAIQSQKYQAQDGTQKTSYGILVNQLTMLGSKQDGSAGSGGGHRTPVAPGVPKKPVVDDGFFNDDVPF